jgi:lipopolysaccharide transport system permease protein
MGRGDDAALVFGAKKPLFDAPWLMMQNLCHHRDLIRHFIYRDLKVRYHNSVLGYGWSIVEPLALTLTFYILFAILSNSVDPYRPLTILLGILSWAFFARILSKGTISLQRNRPLIQRVYFPREIFIFSQAGFQVVQLSLSLLVIVPLLYYYQLMPTRSILLLPIAVILIGMLAMGISFFTSILQTKTRDVEHIVSVFIRISFYLTPVFYPLEMITGSRIPEQYAELYLLVNPMATYITMIRSAFTGQPLDIPLDNLIITTITTLLIFVWGSIFFMRNERKAVKYL